MTPDQRISPTAELYSNSIQYYSLPNNGQKDQHVLFISNYPGPLNVFFELERELQEVGWGIHYASWTASSGQLISDRKYSGVSSDQPKNNIVIVSADADISTVLKITNKSLYMNPNLKIILLEDYPGSTKDVLDEMLEENLIPSVLFTPTISQAQEYTTRFANRGIETQVIQIRNPAFEHFLKSPSFQSKNEQKLARILNIDKRDIVISYFGMPVTDINHETLKTLFSVGRMLATHYLLKNIHLIYKPHPRDTFDLNNLQNPIVAQNLLTARNLKFHSFSNYQWHNFGIQHDDILSTSTFAITVNGSVGLEVPLRWIRMPYSGGKYPAPIHFIPHIAHSHGISPENMLPVKTGASFYAHDELSLLLTIHRWLNRTISGDLEFQLRDGQLKLAREYGLIDNRGETIMYHPARKIVDQITALN